MKIAEDKRFKKSYKLVESDVRFYLCRILNEYDSVEEANKDLVDLLTDNKTDKDLLKEYSKKDIF